jgi:hypothetical protein
MAINAKNLPTLFTASTWDASSRVMHDGAVKCIASGQPTAGLWGLSPDPDLFHVSQADFDDIAAAGVTNDGAGPHLVIDGQPREVFGRLDEDTGVRWIGLRAPVA